MMFRHPVEGHSFVTAVTFDTTPNGDLQIGMATASGLHIVTMPASAKLWLLEHLGEEAAPTAPPAAPFIAAVERHVADLDDVSCRDVAQALATDGISGVSNAAVARALTDLGWVRRRSRKPYINCVRTTFVRPTRGSEA